MPRKAVDSEVRLRSLNLKTTDALRAQLERAASLSGRALTHEVEARLERSFAEENLLVQIFGNPDRARRHNTWATGSATVETAVGPIAPDDGDAMLRRDLLDAETAVCVAKKYRNNAAVSVSDQDCERIALKAIDLAKAAIRKADRGLFLKRYPGDEQSFDPRADEFAARDDPKRKKRGGGPSKAKP